MAGAGQHAPSALMILVPRIYGVSRGLYAGCGTIANRPFIESNQLLTSWAPPLKPLDSNTVDHLASLKVFTLRKQGPPLVVLKDLGSFSEDPIPDGRIKNIFLKVKQMPIGVSAKCSSPTCFFSICFRGNSQPSLTQVGSLSSIDVIPYPKRSEALHNIYFNNIHTFSMLRSTGRRREAALYKTLCSQASPPKDTPGSGEKDE
ncbi:hypothetical protein B0H11DRAFT_1939745 [Mycena galericulata]|nr:hypothetical protein B0H11DRAFT_1939745 [Mycena galericulata]